MLHTVIRIRRQHPQKKPLLLLPDTHGLAVITHHFFRQTVTQPAPRAGDNLDIRRHQTDLLTQLTKQSLLRGFILFDTALGKLPRILPNTPSPKNLSFLVGQNDPNIGTIAIGVNHVTNPKSVSNWPHCSTKSAISANLDLPEIRHFKKVFIA